MLFFAGCKKDDVITPESRIEQLRNQVSDWYNISTKEVLTGPDASTKRIASNSLNTLTSTDYSVLPIESLNFNKSYINFDSLSLTGLTVPMRINKNTGEYIQLTTVSNNKKTKGYFVRSIPDDNWYKKLGVKSDFSRMSGKIFVYNIKGKLISKAILVDGLVVNNLSQNQQSSSGNIKSNNWGFDANGLFNVTVNSYIRHRSWSDLIALAIFDSGNDLGISLGSNYVPFYPFDPSYYYGSATGGSGVIPVMPSAIELAFLHKFPINNDYKTTYPKFYSLVKNLYYTALKDRKTLDALKTYGHFTSDEKLFEILQFGNGAEIEIKDINTGRTGSYRYAHHDPKFPNKIEFEISTIREFELGDTDNARAYSLFLFITLMHESVHYGNTLNSFFEQNYEWGDTWETYVYGRHISTPIEAWDYILRKK